MTSSMLRHLRVGDRASRTAALPAIAAVAVAVLAVGAAVFRGVTTAGSEQFSAAVLAAEIVVILAIGLGLAAVLGSLSHLLNLVAAVETRVHELDHACHQLQSSMSAAAEAVPTPGASPSLSSPSGPETSPAVVDSQRPPWEEILLILRDTRDNTLLSDDERRVKAARIEQEDLSETERIVRSLIAQGDFPRAMEHLAEARRRYPGRPLLDSLGETIERDRSHREAEDVRTYTRRVDELINISAWQRAREVAAELEARHPDSAAARQLADRIEREHALYEDAQRSRMYAEVQRYVTRRRWREALAAAETFIERFPNHSESDALRLQLETLANNAEVTTRQELEAEITEMARRGQYAEAAILARQVIERFPDSPTAEILRSQLERLDELATNPNAPPPRVRPSGVSSNSGQLKLT